MFASFVNSGRSFLKIPAALSHVLGLLNKSPFYNSGFFFLTAASMFHLGGVVYYIVSLRVGTQFSIPLWLSQS